MASERGPVWTVWQRMTPRGLLWKASRDGVEGVGATADDAIGGVEAVLSLKTWREAGGEDERGGPDDR